MSYTRLISFLTLIWTAESICDPTKESEYFAKVFYESDDRIVLGKGSYGIVKEFKYNEYKYAVKEMAFEPSSEIKIMREHLTEYQRKDFDEFANSLKEEFLKDSSIKHRDKKLMSKLFQSYYKEFQSFTVSLIDEVTFSKYVSEEMGKKNSGNCFKFHYCIKVNDLKYMAVYERYGQSLDSENSREFFNKATIEQKLEIYVKIEWELVNLHNINVFHCDLKPANIVWKDKIGGDIVIIDYGFGSKKNCQKSTKGYNAPEFYQATNNGFAPGLMTDVYSLAMLIVHIEFRGLNKNPDLVAKHAQHETNNKLLENHKNFLNDLEGVIEREKKLLIKLYPDRIKNLEHFFLNFFSCLSKMLNPDSKSRLSLQYSYRYVWVLFQISKYLDTDYDSIYYPRNQRFKGIVSNKDISIDILHLNRERGLDFFEKISKNPLIKI
jgi:serine/threonine protein kinase